MRVNRTFWPAFLLGAAIVAAIDEIVFHQILGWHHFYDRGTSEAALVSDGVLHAVELVALVAGGFLLADARRRGRWSTGAAWAGGFTGAGAFQLFDGIVNHKVLGVHQVRYDVDLVAYDVAWIAAGLVLLAVGLLLTARLRGRRRRSEAARA
jgi:uncharacterized membrane protein